MIQTTALPGTATQPDSRAARPDSRIVLPDARTALADARATLDAIVQAYAAGDNPIAERLFSQALDDGLPWDETCAAAARGIAQRFGEQPRG